jgi:hypothetical protein
MRGFMGFAGNISLRAALAVSASGLRATSLLFAFNTLSILAAIGCITLIAVLGARLAAIAIDRALRRMQQPAPQIQSLDHHQTRGSDEVRGRPSLIMGSKPNGERP